MYDILGALKALFEEVHYMDFYRDIFPEGAFEERGEYEDGKYNGIAIAIAKGSKRAKRMTITDDLDTIVDMAGSNDFCLMRVRLAMQVRAGSLPMLGLCMRWLLILTV